MIKKKTVYLNDEQALERMKNYCAYQERCHAEIKNKLISLGVYGDRIEQITSDLIAENFLNETRFAQTYARSKFNYNSWGRIKISNSLRMKQVSSYNINLALKEINEEIYCKVLDKLIEEKSIQLKDKMNWKTNLYQQLLSKGYEQNLIRDRLEKMKE
jgi:regulatory protein